MVPDQFEYFLPKTLDEAVSLLQTHADEARLLAGGQSLISIMKLRLMRPGCLIDLAALPELTRIRQEDNEVVIGAGATQADIKDSQLLADRCPLLPQTASVVADVQVRNRGTLGGSLAHADPAADMPAAILALDASLKAVSVKGERTIPATDFFQSAFTTALAENEILTEIHVPLEQTRKMAYLKNAPRPSDFALVGVAVSLELDSDRRCRSIRIGVTAVSDRAYRASRVEEQLTGQKLEEELIVKAASHVTAGVEVNDDIHASASFRQHLASVYAVRAIKQAAAF